VSNNGMVLKEKGYLREIRLYVPPLWAPSRLVFRQSTDWSNVSGPPVKVVKFAGEEVCVYILELRNRYPGLWWNRAQVKVDASSNVKVPVETFFNRAFSEIERGEELDSFRTDRNSEYNG